MDRRTVMACLLSVFTLASPAPAAEKATAILAGGCFWCVEHDLRGLAGVTDALSGYSGGTRANPTYEDYHDTDDANPTPHVEVVQVSYDPARLSYRDLLDDFVRRIDPTDGGGQFCDRGPAYRPVIFVKTAQERQTAEEVLAGVSMAIGEPVAVEVLPSSAFWPAEDYHQDFAEKNPLRYKYYRWNCGRDQRLEAVWSGAQ